MIDANAYPVIKYLTFQSMCATMEAVCEGSGEYPAEAH